MTVSGTLNTAGGTPGTFGATAPALEIGSLLGGSFPWEGFIDEVRFSNISRSDDWINQTYQIVVNQSTFVTIGSEEIGDVTPPSVVNVTAEPSLVNQTQSVNITAAVFDVETSVNTVQANITFPNASSRIFTMTNLVETNSMLRSSLYSQISLACTMLRLLQLIQRAL